MLTTTDLSFPADNLAHLRTAFDMLGNYRFGPLWTKHMAATVRLGQRSKDKNLRVRGQWALKALTQCVENGWLPLVYFMGGRRVRYFESPDGLSLSALYPQPTDAVEGQIELRGGDIYPCMVHIADFHRVLRSKFALPNTIKRGPSRKHTEFDGALDRFFENNPLSAPYRAIFEELRHTLRPCSWPPRSTAYRRIDEARARATGRAESRH